MKTQTKRFFSVALLSAAIVAHAQDSGVNPGIEAFNAGRYDEALAAFDQQVRESGSTDALQYNIAVSLFRLQRYDQAREHFQALMSKPEWQVLVQYNLGLLAEAQGNLQEAVTLFREGAQQQENERVRRLAQQKLRTLTRTAQGGTRAAPAKRLSALVSVSGGDDSNATSLASELLDTSSNAQDSFHELLVYGQWQLTGTSRDGIRVYGLGFDRAFNEFSRLDSRVLGSGATLSKPLGAYVFETDLRLTRTSLDGEEVADQAQFSLGLSRQWSIGTIRIDLRGSHFDAANAYRQIDGDQHQLDLAWRKRIGDFTVSSRYRFEVNEREDLQRGGAFASYSPTRHALRGELRWQATARLSAGLAAEFIDSRYDDENRLRDVDGTIRQEQRRGEQRRLNADISYRLHPNWLLKAQYQLTDQRDNFDLYRYDKHRVMGTIEYQY